MTKIDEIPYDFVRKRLSVVVSASSPGIDTPGQPLLVTKGALEQVLAVCTSVQTDGSTVPFDDGWKAQIEQRYEAWSQQGFRVLGRRHRKR